MVGRLKDGVSIEQARAEMDAISVQIEQENPRTNKDMRAEVITLREHLVGDVRPAVTLFGGAVHRGAADRVRQRHQPAARARRARASRSWRCGPRLAPAAGGWSASCWSRR